MKYNFLEKALLLIMLYSDLYLICSLIENIDIMINRSDGGTGRPA